MSWIIVSIDIASMVIIVFTIWIIPSSITKRTNFYNLTKIKISDFSIHLRDLNLKGNILYSELSCVIEHIYSVLEIEDKNNFNRENFLLYDLNYPIMTLEQVDLLVIKNNIEGDRGFNRGYYQKWKH